MEKHTKEKDAVFESVTWEAQNYDAAERKFQEVYSAKAWFTTIKTGCKNCVCLFLDFTKDVHNKKIDSESSCRCWKM